LVINKGLKPEIALRQLFQQAQTDVSMSQNIINSRSDEKMGASTDPITEKVASVLKEKLSQAYKHIPRKTEIEV